MIDIDIKSEYGKFKFRVCGIVTKNNKVLVYKDKRLNGYCFPGGHVELGETTQVAVVREMQEELNLNNVTIDRLVCINENIYPQDETKVAHEIAYYYTVTTTDNILTEDFVINEIDKGVPKQHHFCWLNISELQNYTIYPSFMPKLLQSNSKDTQFITTDQR